MSGVAEKYLRLVYEVFENIMRKMCGPKGRWVKKKKKLRFMHVSNDSLLPLGNRWSTAPDWRVLERGR